MVRNWFRFEESAFGIGSGFFGVFWRDKSTVHLADRVSEQTSKNNSGKGLGVYGRRIDDVVQARN